MWHTSSSALYVVDLVKFRETAAGDNLRVFYETLSKDPNSLSNLDQASHHFHDYSVSSSTLSSFNNNSILFYIDSIMKHLSLSTVQNRKKGQTHITLRTKWVTQKNAVNKIWKIPPPNIVWPWLYRNRDLKSIRLRLEEVSILRRFFPT